MIEAAKVAVRDHVCAFSRIYPLDKQAGVTMVVSAFVSCYAMMEEGERFRALIATMEIVLDISKERFEDGPDFLSFLKEKITEKKEQA